MGKTERQNSKRNGRRNGRGKKRGHLSTDFGTAERPHGEQRTSPGQTCPKRRATSDLVPAAHVTSKLKGLSKKLSGRDVRRQAAVEGMIASSGLPGWSRSQLRDLSGLARAAFNSNTAGQRAHRAWTPGRSPTRTGTTGRLQATGRRGFSPDAAQTKV